MSKISKTERLADKVHLMDVEAPRVARACEPGELVIVKMDEISERIPLTICDYDRETGTTTIAFQIVGASTQRMAELQVGDAFQDVMGPLGNPSELVSEDIEVLKNKKMLFVAGGVGTAPVHPQVKWLHKHGTGVDVIMDAKNHDLPILEKQIRVVTGSLYIIVDDGSYVRRGMVTEAIRGLVQEQRKQYDARVAIGSMIMIKLVCPLTKELNLPTTASMNPIMVDGTGMCGACRLTVDDEVKFACVDGPESDGHLVNLDEAMKYQQMYKTQEGRAMLKPQGGDTHHGECGYCGGDK